MGKSGCILGVEKDERNRSRSSKSRTKQVLCIVNTGYIEDIVETVTYTVSFLYMPRQTYDLVKNRWCGRA